MALRTSLIVDFVGVETATSDLSTPMQRIVKEYALKRANGTDNDQGNRIWADTRTAAGSADPIDLLGTLASEMGDIPSISFVDLSMILIHNKATTTGYLLTVGAGSNPTFTGLWGATGDAIKVHPGGLFLWESGGVDAVSPVAATGDLLTVDPGANTVTYDIVLVGRSA